MRISYTLVFAVYAVAEALLLVWFASAFGTAALIGLLLAGFLIGLLVMRIAGISAFSAMASPQRRAASFGVTTADGREDLVIGPQPTAADLQQSVQRTARDVGASSLLFVSGLLFASPGIISDAVAAVLLLPAVRRRIAARWARSIQLSAPGTARITVVTVDDAGGTTSGWSGDERPGGQRPPVIQGEILPPRTKPQGTDDGA